MNLTIETELSYRLSAPTDLLLQVELARVPGQHVVSDALSTTPVDDFRRIDAEAGVGTRAWMRAEGLWEASYRAEVAVTRADVDLGALAAGEARALPAEATSFLMPSRYCPSDLFETLVAEEFSDLAGGPLVVAIRDWVGAHLAYVPGASGPETTARETYLSRQGVCRDFAHVVIALARAGGVPARMASVYAPRVTPPDFHAVAEVWLEDGWHLVDATGMAAPSEMAVIGVGRDAAEVSFLTTLGMAEMMLQRVTVQG